MHRSVDIQTGNRKRRSLTIVQMLMITTQRRHINLKMAMRRLMSIMDVMRM